MPTHLGQSPSSGGEIRCEQYPLSPRACGEPLGGIRRGWRDFVTRGSGTPLLSSLSVPRLASCSSVDQHHVAARASTGRRSRHARNRSSVRRDRDRQCCQRPPARSFWSFGSLAGKSLATECCPHTAAETLSARLTTIVILHRHMPASPRAVAEA